MDEFVEKCQNKRCKTCPMVSTSPYIESNISKKVYLAINSSSLKVSCRSQNVIYSLSCNHCNQQYLCETTTQLSLRMNTHRTSVAGCELVIRYKKNCESNVFTLQILEKLKGDGYGDDNKPDPTVTKLRQDREDFWIKRLRTVYPYGINHKAFDKLSSSQGD